MGTEESPIIFSSASSSPAGGDWHGIRVVADAADASVDLSYCTIEYGSVGIAASSSTYRSAVSISHCTIRHSSGDGIYVYGKSGSKVTLDIRDGLISENNGKGVYTYVIGSGTELSGAVSGNTISNNGGIGLYSYSYDYAKSDLTISDNTVHHNTSYGICLQGYDTYESKCGFAVENNTVNASGKGIYCNGNNSDTSVEIVGNEVYESTDGIYCSGYGTSYGFGVLISGNTVRDNSSRGIYCYSDAASSAGRCAEITANSVYRNSGDGIQLDTRENLESVLILNSVTENGGIGVYCNSSGSVKVAYNDVRQNNTYDFYNYSSLAVDARCNFWGESATLEMASGGFQNISTIYDIFDNASKGVVNYLNWLDASPGGPPSLFSKITDPASGDTLREGSLTISGIAYAAQGVERVEISMDSGITWNAADIDARFIGKTVWSYAVSEIYGGSYTIMSRVVDKNGQTEAPGDQIALTINRNEPTTYGALIHNETWSGTIRLEGDITVPEGVILSILPGTTLEVPALFDAEYGGSDSSRTELIINGELIALGTEDQPIVFTSNSPSSPKKGDWGGIKVSGDGTLQLNYVTVEYSSYGVSYSRSSGSDDISIANCTIHHTSGCGINIYADGGASFTVVIENSTITGNSGQGVYTYAYGVSTTINVSLLNNTISGNGGPGIYCYADGRSGTPVIVGNIVGNTISGHTDYGVYCYTRDEARSNLNIENNTIHNCVTGIITNYYYGPSEYDSSQCALTISNNTVHTQKKGIEVYCNYSTLYPQILNNAVHDHSGNGITCSCESINQSYPLVPYLEGNQVFGNGGRGVYIYATKEVTLLNNSLYSNSSYDLYNGSSYPIKASTNWWGVDTTNEMNTGDYPKNIDKIYDSFDNSGKGAVDYSNWLSLYEIPSAPTLDPVTSPTMADSQTLSGMKDANTAIVLNGVEVIPADASTSWSFEKTLTEGNNALTLYARSAAGMTSEAVVTNVIKDTTIPQVYASTPAAGAIVRRMVESIDIILLEESTQVDPDATLAGAVVVDGQGVEVPGEWTINYNHVVFTPDAPIVEDGSYTVTLHPTDMPLGNTQTATITFSIDMIAPAVLSLNEVTTPTKTTPQTISGGKEAGTSVWLDGAVIVALDDAVEWSCELALKEGENTHRLFASDIAGNKSEETVFTIVRDSVAPVLQSSEPVNGAYVKASPARVAFFFTDQTTALDGPATIATATMKTSAGQTVPGSWSIEQTNNVVFTPDAPIVEGGYTASVQAYDLAGNSVKKTIAFGFDVTLPVAPTLSPVTSPTTYSVQTLSGAKEANSSIWINGVQVVAINSSTSWSYQIKLVQGDNALEIYSKDAADNKSASVHAVIAYDETAPLPVSNLTASGDGQGTSVVLNWTGYNESVQGDVDYYRIYAQTSLFTQVGSMTPLAAVDAGTFRYTVTNLTKDVRYYFAVVAVDVLGNAVTSVTPVSVVPTDTIPPENVVNLKVECFEDELFFQWGHSANSYGDLAGYVVYLGADAEGVELAASATSFSATGLLPVAAYPVVVTALDASGNESSGVSMTAVTLLDNPANVTATPYSGKVSLTWSKVQPAEYVKHYAVYASDQDFSSVEGMTPKVTTTGTSANVAGLTNGVGCYFAVTTVNISGGEQKVVATTASMPTADAQGPVISNVKLNGAALTGSAELHDSGTFSLTASDPAGMSRVEFYLDGSLYRTDSNGGSNYSCSLNIYSVANGSHTLTITAFDTLGNSTSVTYTVTVALDLPPAPTITSPSSGSLVNTTTIKVSGRAKVNTEVAVYDNGSLASSWAAVSGSGAYSASVALAEGENRLRAVARNRTGEGPLSAEVLVTLDTTLPESPTHLSATAQTAGVIRLSWSKPAGTSVKGYNLYRATAAFDSPADAAKVNSGLITATSLNDLPAADAVYTYRASAVDSAGNESALSNSATATSDRVLPQALSIDYDPEGPYDPATGRMAAGVVNVRLQASEALQTTPFLTINPSGATPLSVDLTKQSDVEYTGFFVISDTAPTGTAYAVFSARDLVGNRGTEIASGALIHIDTAGPAISHITIDPAQPVRNDSANPVSVTATIGLNEAMKSGGTPSLSYLLSAKGRTATAVAPMTKIAAQTGHAETWQGVFVLPSDAGQAEVETLQFIFRGTDDLGNNGERILCANSFQVYQGELPPLEPPTGLKGEALPGGKIKLFWNAVEGAAGYELHRKAPGEAGLAAYQRFTTELGYTDAPSVDGTYTYAVASIRRENGQESVSGLSGAVEVTSDSVVPDPPLNLALELTSQGVKATWEAAPDTEPVAYSLYRADLPQIDSTAGLKPVRSGVAELTTIDTKPSPTDHCYVATAVDRVGNESLPSNSFYLNFELLPVSTLSVRQEDDASPVVSWTHAGGSIAGFDVYLGDVKLNGSLHQGFSYTDTGYTGDERTYRVVAVDDNGAESPGRSITLPVVRASLNAGESLGRGVMNRLEYSVESQSSNTVDNIKLQVAAAGRSHVSETFSVAGGASQAVSVVVGGYSDLPDTTELTTTVAITPSEGETVAIVRSSDIAATDDALALGILNEELLKGGAGKVRFTLQNTGEEEIEIVTATGSGASDSNEIAFQLLDGEGNVLSTKSYRQSLGENVITLSSGVTVARIPAGSVFTSEPVELSVPSASPDSVTVKVRIAKIYYHKNRSDQVSMDGVSTTHDVALAETSYYGELLVIAPQSSNGDRDVVITGRAVERSTGLPLGGAALDLVITVNGFERAYKVFTGSDGQFSHTFTPLSGESGTYSVRAVHPDLTDKPVQGQFVINRITVSPTTVNLSVPKSYQQTMSFSVKAGEGTSVHNLRLAYEEKDQPSGVFPTGVHLTVGSSVASLGSKGSATLKCTVWADNTAQATGKFTLKVKSDETGEGAWAVITVNTSFSEAQPSLSYSPDHVETGLALGDTVVETITLENKGLAALNDVTLKLLTQEGSAAPSWVQLSISPSLGTLAVGEKRAVPISLSPASGSVEEGTYTFYLQVSSSNYGTRSIPIYASVTQSGVGNALFKVSDIYTGTVDAKTGNVVQGLSGASIRMQNEEVLSVDQTIRTDAYGEALFTGLPSGKYKCRVTASNHQEHTGRVWIKPGVTASEEVFLEYNLVTVEWEVVETTVQDKYEIVLKVTYETNVPAAVVVVEPTSVTLPDMETGDVYYGELALTNYGLVRADDLVCTLPSSNEYFKYELMEGLPSSLGAKERIVVPYRVTCLNSPSQKEETGSGGGCQRSLQCGKVAYKFECANGTSYTKSMQYCFTYDNGECTGSSGSSGSTGGSSGGSASYSWSSGGSSGSTWSPSYEEINGVVCWPEGELKESWFDCGDSCLETRQNIFFDVGCAVNAVLREYTDAAVDLSVKAPGGSIAVERLYYGNAWRWEHERNNLRFEWDSLGQFVDSIDKGGVVYERAFEYTLSSSGEVSLPDTLVYTHASYTITGTESTGWRWEDKAGNWKEFDASGRMSSFGSPDALLGKLLYDGSQRVVGVADAAERQVLWIEHDASGLIAAVRDASGRQVTYSYTNGLLTGVTDALGNVTAYSYDGEGRITKTVDGAGRSTLVSYDKYGNASQVVDGQGNGHFFDYSYDAAAKESYAAITTSSGMVKEVWYDKEGETRRVDVNGRTLQEIAKDGRNLLITDEKGNITRKELDEWDNIIRIVYPEGSSASFEYEHTFNKLTRMSDPRGSVSAYRYDDRGNLVEKVEAVGTGAERTTTYTYDQYGQLLSATMEGDALTEAATTTLTYDASGNIASITDPEGNRTEFLEYDAMGNMLRMQDARGNVWSFAYDALGRLVSRSCPIGCATAYEYDGAGNRTAMIDAALKRFDFEYDAHDNRIKAVDPYAHYVATAYNTDNLPTKVTDQEGRVTEFEYDNEGRLLQAVDGAGNATGYHYDASQETDASSYKPVQIDYPTYSKKLAYDKMQRVVLETDILDAGTQRFTSYTYDAAGNMVTKTDPERNATAYAYDALNRLVKVTDALGGVSEWGFDDRGNCVSVKDPSGGVTRYAYNRNNRLVKMTLPMGEETSYAYDAVGNRTAVHQDDGGKIAYEYNAVNRLTKILHFTADDPASPAKTVELAYDALGRMVSYSDGSTSAAYVYDDLGRKTSESVNYGHFTLSYSYAYAANGYKKSFTGPDGVTYGYTYDANNRLSGVSIPEQGHITTNAYQWNSSTRITLPGGSTTDYGYDPLMQLQSITLQDPGQNTAMDYRYARSASGSITSKETEHGSYDYAYDKLYRLTEATKPDTDAEAYTYDALGNRLTAASHDGLWSYNANNQLLSYADISYEYDDNGNMIRKLVNGVTAFHYIYDVEDRLVRVERGDGTTVAAYYYDPFGRRLWKEVDGVKTYFLYADEGLVGEYDAEGNAIRTYGYAPDSVWSTNPLFQKAGDSYYWYQNDHLGAPQKMLDTSGRIVWSASYDSFGNITIETEAIPNNLRLAGQYQDEETGLYYNWNRYYDPSTGRYISADPIGLDGGMNLYAYVQNDPVNWIDPNGLFQFNAEFIEGAGVSGKFKVSGVQVELKLDLGSQHTPLYGSPTVSEGAQIKAEFGQWAVGVGAKRSAPGKPHGYSFDQCGRVIPDTGLSVNDILRGIPFEWMPFLSRGNVDLEWAKLTIGAQVGLGFEVTLDFKDEVKWLNSHFF
jgi:RHS repeat-associated protein